jgi:hypothetical protein
LQLVPDLGQPTQAMARDWKRLKLLPHRGQVICFVVLNNCGVIPLRAISGVNTIKILSLMKRISRI